MKPNLKNFIKNLIVISFLILIVAPGVRSLVKQDNRFGWGMFSSQVKYRVEYYLVLEDSRRIKYRPDKELVGKVRGRLSSGNHSTNYGPGAALSWIRGYVNYMYPRVLSDKVTGFEAHVRYNSTMDEEYKEEIITYIHEENS